MRNMAENEADIFALRILHAGFFHRLLHLLGREVFDVSRKRPFVPVRIGHESVAIAPEHVLCRHHDRGRGVLRRLIAASQSAT